MKTKLNKELKMLLDFYLKQRQSPPHDFAYAPGVIPNPSFFTVKSLQEHLNNPLLNPAWVHVVSNRGSVSLEQACMFKKVQSNQLNFMDKAVLNDELKNGAAVILEGIDILDSSISTFVGKVEDALPCSLSGCVAFFSQKGNEAYDAHCDSDDVLVIQLSGKKLWHIYERQQRRFAETTHLKGAQLGPKIKELTMHPGDAMYLRAGVPHMCNTASDHSLHLAFDLIDITPNVEQITQEANKAYEYACEDPHAPPSKILERYINLLKSDDFQAFLEKATNGVKEDARKFRQSISNASGVRALSKYF
jgi:hypothetical protein